MSWMAGVGEVGCIFRMRHPNAMTTIGTVATLLPDKSLNLSGKIRSRTRQLDHL